ncbi:MAG: hypothetical protein KDA21_05300 [Phycisphaerales bacterium]|nr:hypothetical protein [Phycisphaerales bacterium]
MKLGRTDRAPVLFPDGLDADFLDPVILEKDLDVLVPCASGAGVDDPKIIRNRVKMPSRMIDLF